MFCLTEDFGWRRGHSVPVEQTGIMTGICWGGGDGGCSGPLSTRASVDLFALGSVPGPAPAVPEARGPDVLPAVCGVC